MMWLVVYFLVVAAILCVSFYPKPKQKPVTSEPYLSKYSVEILSSPSKGGPWVVQFDNILTETEANHLIELGGKSFTFCICHGKRT